MPRSSYELDVLVRGKSVKKYVHGGKVYIEGRKDSEYTITFQNNTHSKVLAVITVDGLSIMDGEQGSYDSPGYVVDARGKIRIPGWRLNHSEIAKFKFGCRGDSYAETSGKGGNIGIVGCAVFNEDMPGWLTIDAGGLGGGGGVSRGLSSHRFVAPGTYCGYLRTSDTSDGIGLHSTITTAGPLLGEGDDLTFMASDNGSVVTCDSHSYNPTVSTTGGVPETNPHGTSLNQLGVAAPNLGTEFGSKSSHQVTEVVFHRKKNPSAIIEVHYDDRAGLRNHGIDLNAPKAYVAKAFPDAPSGVGCTPPENWNG